MKKQLLNLSLSTALSTALLTTFLPTTNLQASNVPSSSGGIILEDSVIAKNSLLVPSHVGIAIDKTTLPSNDQYVIHSHTADTLAEYFTTTVVYFENEQAYFTYLPKTDEEGGELKYELKAGKNFSSSERLVIQALVKPLETWVAMRNDFIKRYFQYRADARDATLLGAVNQRYAKRAISMNRAEPLDTALDGTYGRVMSQILGQTLKDALGALPPITTDFDMERDGLWISLAAATLPEESYSIEVASTVDGNRLKQLAFEGTHAGLIFTNEEFASLISNLCSKEHQLPRSPDESYQNLLGAEAVLAMVMYQRYLVDPEAVDSLFALNAEALKGEQQVFAESAIRNERSHRLLATDLVPVDMLRAQDRLLAKVDFTDEEADAYGNAGNDRDEKALIVASAKARILKEGRDAARFACGVQGLTDTEADNWNYYDERKNQVQKDRIVDLAKTRLAHIEEEKAAALLLKRSQAREAGGVEFTDEEADAYGNADSLDVKAEIVEQAKARLVQEAEEFARLRQETRETLNIKDLTDGDIELYLATEGDEARKLVLKTALERIIAETQASNL